MSIWMRRSAKVAALSIMLLVCLAVVVFALSTRERAAALAARARGNPGPTPEEARHALIKMLNQLPESRESAPIFEVALNRLRRGTGMRFVEHDNPQEVEWEFNCDMKRRRFSFFTEPFKPTLKSFHSEGRFAFEDGRWHARDFHWEWLTCFDRATERSRQSALELHEHPHRSIGFALP